MPREQEHISHMYLKLGGADVSEDIMNSIISMEVDDNLNLPDTFTIHVRDSKLTLVDSDSLALGKLVEISVKGQSGTAKLMEGEITAVEPRFSRSTAPTLIVRGYDKCHRLNREKKTCSFNQVTDSDIATKIARKVGLRAKVDSTREVHEYVLQDNQTDWEFLWDRAQRISYRVFVEGDELHFRKVPDGAAQVPVLEWGVNLLEFNPRINTSQQVGEVIVRGWDSREKKEIVGRATRAEDTPEVGQRDQGGEVAERAFGVVGKEVIEDRPVATQAEADALAQSICDEIGQDFITAEGFCSGNPAVQAGAMIELKSVGDRLSGKYRVSHALHRYDVEGYTTEFTIGGRHGNTLGELLAPKRARSHSPVVGVVTNNNDPKDLGRVKVKLPSRGNQELDWARYVSPGGGNDRGFMWLPEVGDEVLVIFEHDDIHRPFVLGGLWSKQDKPPAPSSKCLDSQGKVIFRGLESRTHMMLLVSDQPNEKWIGLVNPDRDICIYVWETDNVVLIKSRGDVRIKGDSKVSVEGAQIELKADGNLKIEGGGIVEIKGAQIKLN